MASMHFLLKAIQFLVLILKVYLKILFHAIEFLIIIYLLTDHLQNLYEAFETCVLVNNNLCEKFFSSLVSSARFDPSFKVTLVPLFIPDRNLLSCELDNSTFKVLY